MSDLDLRKNGFVILIVLVVVAILLLLYFVQIKTFFGPSLPNESVGIEQHPWVLEQLLIPKGQDIKLPRKPKLQLDKPFSCTVPVMRKEAERGEVTIWFERNGRIRAMWECLYRQSGQAHHLQAQATGNIHTTRTYRDVGGKDKSRLFFIAKGKYHKRTLASASDPGDERGTVWLTGWIDPDRSMQGHLTLTTNQQWTAVYAF
jgi:hypothetical protein